MDDVRWYDVEAGDLSTNEVKAVVAGGRAVCLARTDAGLSALDNRCPHQGGPLGEGTIEDGWLICPWHGYEYDPGTGTPPGGYDDAATPSRLKRPTIPFASDYRPSSSKKRSWTRWWT